MFQSTHPTRVRGLKHGAAGNAASLRGVAPHAGAWIETQCNCRHETQTHWSHPTRVRGLKLPARLRREKDAPIAPLTGA